MLPSVDEYSPKQHDFHAINVEDTWNGLSTNGMATPQLLIADLNGYTMRPEGLDLINVNGEWRILFVEGRFVSPGYATRNAIHWPISIVGSVQ